MNDEINISNDRDLLEDAEGHAAKVRFNKPAGEDDTEGNGMRVRFNKPAGEDDDTDGHGIRPRI